MLKFRFAISAAVAALALGSASAMAMQANNGGTNHGALVSSAARTTCHTAASGTHGQCVSAIASSNGQAHRNGGNSQNVRDCKAKGLRGRDFGACVSGHAKQLHASQSGGDDSENDSGDTTS